MVLATTEGKRGLILPSSGRKGSAFLPSLFPPGSPPPHGNAVAMASPYPDLFPTRKCRSCAFGIGRKTRAGTASGRGAGLGMPLPAGRRSDIPIVLPISVFRNRKGKENSSDRTNPGGKASDSSLTPSAAERKISCSPLHFGSRQPGAPDASERRFRPPNLLMWKQRRLIKTLKG